MSGSLTPAQVVQVAAAAGFTGQALTNAVAVALAESGGNPTAVNVNHDKYRSRDRGLWQINSHWHPEVSDAAAFNPSSCASAAYRISGGGRSWSAWSTWKNGAAAAQMGRARLAVGSVPRTASGAVAPVNWLTDIPGKVGHAAGDLLWGDPLDAGVPPENKSNKKVQQLKDAAGLGNVGGAITGTLGGLETITKLAVRGGAWVADAHNWSRIVMVAGGAVAVLAGLEMIGKSGAVGSTAANVAAMPGRAARTAATAAKDAAAVAVMA